MQVANPETGDGKQVFCSFTLNNKIVLSGFLFLLFGPFFNDLILKVEDIIIRYTSLKIIWQCCAVTKY